MTPSCSSKSSIHRRSVWPSSSMCDLIRVARNNSEARRWESARRDVPSRTGTFRDRQSVRSDSVVYASSHRCGELKSPTACTEDGNSIVWRFWLICFRHSFVARDASEQRWRSAVMCARYRSITRGRYPRSRSFAATVSTCSVLRATAFSETLRRWYFRQSCVDSSASMMVGWLTSSNAMWR